MRSRHNEPGMTCKGGSPPDGYRFGGYGFAVNKNGWNAKREPTHNCHDQHKSGSVPRVLENGKVVKLRQSVKDRVKWYFKQVRLTTWMEMDFIR